MPYNFAADSFHTKKLCSRLFSKRSAILDRNRPFCVFEPTFGAREQRTMIIESLLVLSGLFSLGVTSEALRANIGIKWAISLQRGRLTQNGRPHQPFFFLDN